MEFNVQAVIAMRTLESGHLSTQTQGTLTPEGHLLQTQLH